MGPLSEDVTARSLSSRAWGEPRFDGCIGSDRQAADESMVSRWSSITPALAASCEERLPASVGMLDHCESAQRKSGRADPALVNFSKRISDP